MEKKWTRKSLVQRRAGDVIALNVIQKNQPINVYKLSKLLGLSYTGTVRLVKDLERRKKIRTELKTVRTVRLIYLYGSSL